MNLPKVVVDIETYAGEPTPNEIEAWAFTWTPPSNYKSKEAIDKKKQTDLEKWNRSGALSLSRAKVVSVALAQVIGDKVFDLDVSAGGDEAKVMEWFVDYLSELGSGCQFVGYNVDGFDLPILCRALHTHSLSLPFPLGKWDSIDLMNKPFKSKLPLKDLVRAFGIERDEQVKDIDGSGVAKLVKNKAWSSLALYNKEDVRITAELFIALSRMWAL